MLDTALHQYDLCSKVRITFVIVRKMTLDPLSDVLSLLKPRNYMSAGFDAGGDWSIQFPDQQKSIKTGAIVSGACWLSVEGVAEPVYLETGDCFLLPSGRPFRMASHLSVPPVPAAEIFAAVSTGGMVTHKGGGDVCLVSSRFALAGHHADMLLALLPPIIHIQSDDDQAGLRWLVEHMVQELRDQRPGGFLVAQHLAHMMLVQALRLHLAEGAKGGIGWLFALADKQIGPVISAIHANPARHWSLQTLAEQAGMSRSTFALKFKETVGTSAIDYLTRWRIVLASDRLVNSDDPISVIAFSLGYASESAFSTAFKRLKGCPPRHYSRNQTAIIAAQTVTIDS